MDGGSPSRSSFRSPKNPSPLHDLRGDHNAARRAANLSFASKTNLSRQISSFQTHSLSVSQPAAIRAAAQAAGVRSGGSNSYRYQSPSSNNDDKIRYTPTVARTAISNPIDPLVAAQASVKGQSRFDSRNATEEIPSKGTTAFSSPLTRGGNLNSPDTKRLDSNQLKLPHGGIDGPHGTAMRPKTPSAIAATLAASKGIDARNDRGQSVNRSGDLESNIDKSLRANSPQNEHANISASIAFNNSPLSSMGSQRKTLETQLGHDKKPMSSGTQIELFAPRPLQASSLINSGSPSISSALTAALITSQQERNLRPRPVSVASSRTSYPANSNAFEAAMIAVRNDTVSGKREEFYQGDLRISKKYIHSQAMSCGSADGQTSDPQRLSLDDDRGWSIYQNPPYTQSARSSPTRFTLPNFVPPSSEAAAYRPVSVPCGNNSIFGPPPQALKPEQYLQPSHTGDSMEYARAASSLASSRGPSPAKGLVISAMPSRTPIAMRTTMRKDKKQKATLPQEMDFPGYRQLRRYESLWASNRGLYLDQSCNADGVCSVITKDIWSRSRLPLDVLEKIWDLVYKSPDVYRSYLTRDEFILGLFLIDRSLMGMKTPHKVDEELLASISRNGFFKKSNKKKIEREVMKKKGKKG